jgi:hypothetical protein
MLTVPSGSEDVMERVIGEPVNAAVADSVNLTVGGLSLMVLVAIELCVVWPELSVALV